MSGCCSNCTNGTGSCGGGGCRGLTGDSALALEALKTYHMSQSVRGVGAFTAVRAATQASVRSRGSVVPAAVKRAASFDSLVRPVSNGPLATRMEPGKRSLGGLGGAGLRGVGAQERVAPFSSSEASTIYHSMPPALLTNVLKELEKTAGLKGRTGAVARTFIDPLGAVLFGGGMLGGGIFEDEAKKRKQKNLAMYANAWNSAKGTVVDQITRTQRRLDTIDRDMIALDKTLASQDGAVSENGKPPSGVAKLVADAKNRRKDAESVVQVLRDTQDALNAAADVVKQGEQSGQTGPGSTAQRALEKAAQVAAGVDAQISTVARAVSQAVSVARAATTAVNRWVEQEANRRQAEQQRAHELRLSDELARKLMTPPQGWVYDQFGNLQQLVGPQVAPPLLGGQYFPPLQEPMAPTQGTWFGNQFIPAGYK